MLGVFGALAGRAQPERARGRELRRRAARRCSTSPASATSSGCASRVTRDDYRVMPSTEHFGAALSAASLALSRARAARSGSSPPPGRPRCSCRTRSRPATTRRRTRATSRRGGGAIVVPETRARPRPGRRPLAGRRRRRGSRRCARRCATLARPDAAERVAEELIALARRVGGSGCRDRRRRDERLRPARARAGAPRSAAGTGTRRRTSTLFARPGSRCACRRSRTRPRVARSSSRARTGFPGRTRAELLAELVSLRRSIVVAGAHGKTTTAAMIAFVLRELGLDPAWLVGGEVPQLGSNAGAGDGWLVVEGDESDRTIESLRPRDRGDHERRPRPPRDVRLARRGRGRVRRGSPPRRRSVVRGDELEPVRGPSSRSRASTTAGTRRRRSRRSRLAGVARADAERALASFRGAGRRLELRGEARRRRRLDDYAHNPAKVAAVLAAAREPGPTAACSSSSSRTCSRARGTRRTSSAPRSRRPTPSRSRTSTRRASSRSTA